MRKETYVNTLEYIYDGTRKNAKYSVDNGETWKNHGEYCEILAKKVLGYEPKKDGCTAFDKGDDIPEIKASVKSQNCGLTECKDMPKTPAEFMAEFWKRDASEQFIWVYDYAESVDLWYMDRNEFARFVNQFATWDGYCVKYRIKTCNNKINAWLEAQI